jgi:hypothetical protein
MLKVARTSIYAPDISTDLASICFDPASEGTQEEIAIHRRPTPESLESLRLTLQKLEQTGDSRNDNASISDLKRSVLNRIADLELTKKLETTVEEIDDPHGPADLILPSLAEEDPSEDAVDEIPLNKLD